MRTDEEEREENERGEDEDDREEGEHDERVLGARRPARPSPA